MAAPLPLLFLVLVARRLAGRCAGLDGRGALLLGAVATGFTVVAVTEVLSLFRAFHTVGVAAGWVLAIGAVACVGGGTPAPRRPRPGPDLLVWPVAAIALLVGAIALAAPPNTWDATTYHLARVGHWVQGQTVAFHPTANSRQNELGPFAEFAIAHLQLLSSGDRLANLVQWGAMVGCFVAVSRIAAQIGGGVRAQALSALFVATLPMGILQGSSSQNDFVAAFWLATLASFAIDLERQGFRGPWLLGAAGALGLGVLTKGTVPPYAVAPLVALGLARRRDGLGLLRPAALGLVLVLVLNLGHGARNFASTGSPLGPSGRYRVEAMGPRLLASNVARNLGLHLASPWEGWNRGVDRTIRGLHGALGLEIDPPETTYRRTGFAVPAVGVGEDAAWTRDPAAVIRHEDHAGNPLHLLVILALTLLVAHPRLRAEVAARRLCVVSVGAFLVFCALLRWQPWHSRLHLPAFVLVAPFVGHAVVALLGRRAAVGLAAILVMASLPWLLTGLPRPVLGEGSVFTTPRDAQYLASRPHRAASYLGAVDHLRASGCRRIGLQIGGDSAESPWFALLDGPEGPPDLFHLVPGAPRLDPPPCAILTTGPTRESADYRGARYAPAWRSPDVIILEPQDGLR